MQIKKYSLFVFVVCFQFVPFFCKGQDSLIDFLVRRIARQQVQQDNYFFKGIYPSYISNNGKFNTKKKDNNIFFNCLIAYTLSDLKPFLSKENSVLIDSMRNAAKPLYAKFRNKKRDTYNFWRTDSTFDFPFPTIFNFYQKDVTLPDDMDCTVLSLLALDASDSIAGNVHNLLQRFINRPDHRVRSVIPLYNTIPAYSTWLGIKFPVVFDVSVLCNVLTFVQTYHLPWTRADSASLDVIIKTIQHNYHVSKPIYASPVYPTTPVILYHIARLEKVKQVPELEELKIKLVTDAAKQLLLTHNLLEKVILSNAILKWGYTPPVIPLPAVDEMEQKIEKNNFSFFIANLPSYFTDFLKVVATRKRLGYYNYYCPAYNDALLLEYIILKNRDKKN